MDRIRLLAFSLALLLAIPLVSITTENAEGGRPIFAANIRAVWDETNWTQKPKDIEVAPDGRIYIAFHSNHRYMFGVYVVHSDDGGRSWSRSFRVDDVLWDGNASNDRTNQVNPTMVIADNGTVYVAWEDWRAVYFKDPSDPRSRAAHIRIAWSADGENFTRSVKVDPVKLNPDNGKIEPTWHSHNPDLVKNDAGLLYCVWEDRAMEGAYKNIWGSYSTDGGVSWSYPVIINGDRRDLGQHRDHNYARVAIGPAEIYVTWYDDRDQNFGIKPYLAVSIDGGVTFSMEKQITDDFEHIGRKKAWPTVDGNGVLYLSWIDWRSGSDSPEIWFARSEDRGLTISPNMRVVISPEDAQDRDPCITAMGDGVLGIVWERRIPTPTGTESEIFYINSTDGGRTWGAVMRVDDTDRFRNDITNQEDPLVTFDNTGRALSAWSDGRNYHHDDPNSRDVYFSRHSGSLSGPNHPPEITAPLFRGEFDFNPTVGSATSMFNFTFIYKDENNDVPRGGYPRIQIFRNDLGEGPLFPEWRVMRKDYPGDIDYMDGVNFSVELSIGQEGEFFWQIDVVEERNPAHVYSPILPGPTIDATAPALTAISPDPRTWMATNKVKCIVRIEDAEGGNINPATIRYQKTVVGLEGLERGVPVDGWRMIDSNTYEGWATVSLRDGIDNYVVFEAKDRVNNGPGLSEPLNLWLDSTPPYYTKIEPSVKDIQLYADVNCSISWMDHLPGSTNYASSGMDPTTIMYQYRTTSGPYSDWMYPDGLRSIGNDSYRAWTNLEFLDEGVYNYIRWSGKDALGNSATTAELRIRVDIPDNYPPRFVGKAYPSAVVSELPHFFWDEAFDEEGDRLYYSVRLKYHESKLLRMNRHEVDTRTFFDMPANQPLSPGWYVLEVNVTDRIGGYDLLEHVFHILDKGVPPPEKVPVVGAYYLDDEGYLLEMNDSLLNDLVLGEFDSIKAEFEDNGIVLSSEAFMESVALNEWEVRDPSGGPSGGPITYSIFVQKSGVPRVYHKYMVEWPPSPSGPDMNVTYMVRLGTRTYAGDVLEWTDVGDDPGLPRGLFEPGVGIYSLQVMATSNCNYSRVTEGMLKINDYGLELDAPPTSKAYRGLGASKAKPLKVTITNHATFIDNVTVILEGELVSGESDWAYIHKSGSHQTVFRIESSRKLTDSRPVEVDIFIEPPAEVEKGFYSLRVRIVSEDGSNQRISDSILIEVTDAPAAKDSSEFTDDLYDFLVDVFPFLDWVPKGLLLPVFFLVVILIISLVVMVAVLINKRGRGSRTKRDPYAEQRRIYVELYGEEPTQEALEEFTRSQENKDIIGGVDLSIIPDRPISSTFDEDYLESESSTRQSGADEG